VPFLYHFAAVAIVAVPPILAQGYVRTATGDVTHVNDADAIATSPRTKYYIARNVCMHLDKPASHGFATNVGRSNETLVFDLYVMAPICSATNEASIERQVWLGLNYRQSVSNSASDAAKKSTYNSFALQSLHAFNAEDPRRYQFLETLGHNSDRKRYEKTLQLSDYRVAAPVILVPHVEPFERRTGTRLVWLMAALTIGPLVWLTMVMVPALDQSRIASAVESTDPARRPPPPFILHLFVPTRDFYGLPLLVDANIAVFLAMALAGFGRDVVRSR